MAAYRTSDPSNFTSDAKGLMEGMIALIVLYEVFNYTTAPAASHPAFDLLGTFAGFLSSLFRYPELFILAVLGVAAYRTNFLHFRELVRRFTPSFKWMFPKDPADVDLREGKEPLAGERLMREPVLLQTAEETAQFKNEKSARKSIDDLNDLVENENKRFDPADHVDSEKLKKGIAALRRVVKSSPTMMNKSMSSKTPLEDPWRTASEEAQQIRDEIKKKYYNYDEKNKEFGTLRDGIKIDTVVKDPAYVFAEMNLVDIQEVMFNVETFTKVPQNKSSFDDVGRKVALAAASAEAHIVQRSCGYRIATELQKKMNTWTEANEGRTPGLEERNQMVAEVFQENPISARRFIESQSVATVESGSFKERTYTRVVQKFGYGYKPADLANNELRRVGQVGKQAIEIARTIAGVTPENPYGRLRPGQLLANLSKTCNERFNGLDMETSSEEMTKDLSQVTPDEKETFENFGKLLEVQHHTVETPGDVAVPDLR